MRDKLQHGVQLLYTRWSPPHSGADTVILNRRAFLNTAAAVTAVGCAGKSRAIEASATSNPEFEIRGIYLDSAYTHPIPRVALESAYGFLQARHGDASRRWPHANARDAAAAGFARLIGAKGEEIAVVPSTMQGENQVVQAMRIGPGRGVVTESLHYDASLILYGEMQKQGTPVAVVEARDGAVNLEDFAKAITPETRLIAVSLISSVSGYEHDLKALCDLAHARGVLVYADIIQAVGAMPIDVKASGVDFCCAGSYKFLMGDFGAAYLYVRPEILHSLKRTMVGWRQVADNQQKRCRFDAAPGGLGNWEMRSDTASIFEVSTPAWGALALTAASIEYIESIGVSTIVHQRTPLVQRLRNGMNQYGFEALTPDNAQGPLVCFAKKACGAILRDPLKEAGITVSLYENSMRVSLSTFNTANDIDSLLQCVQKSYRNGNSI